MKQPELLLQYQKLDIKVSKIERKLMKSALRSNLMKVRNYLLDSQKQMQDHENEIGEINTHLRDALKRYNAIEDSINEIDSAIENLSVDSSIKEAQMLIRKAKEKITLLERQEKDVNSLQKQIVHIEENIHKIATNVPRYKGEYSQLKTRYDQEHKNIAQECTPMKKEMKELVTKLDPSMLKRYKAVHKSHSIAVVRLNGTRCMGCNMELPSVMARKAAASETLFECENCGRLLYVREE